jgi:hypothetical protein
VQNSYNPEGDKEKTPCRYGSELEPDSMRPAGKKRDRKDDGRTLESMNDEKKKNESWKKEDRRLSTIRRKSDRRGNEETRKRNTTKTEVKERTNEQNVSNKVQKGEGKLNCKERKSKKNRKN